MATISDALRYMADREVQITQRQRQGMDYALDLGSVGEGVSHLFSFSLKF